MILSELLSNISHLLDSACEYRQSTNGAQPQQCTLVGLHSSTHDLWGTCRWYSPFTGKIPLLAEECVTKDPGERILEV